MKLLHRHLGSLILTFKDTQEPGSAGLDQVNQIHTLAQSKALSSQQALDSLPALPQFCCTIEHARLTLRQQRAALALELLDRLRQRS